MQREEYVEKPELVQQRQGFSLLDLKRYVEARGYRGLGLGKLEFPDIVERAPIMVPLQLHDYSHFVVFRGMLRDRVLLADPAWGNRTMQIEDFQRALLNHPEYGRVGFVVARTDGAAPPNLLVPEPDDFVTLN